jgi:hypothetical protein
MTEQTSPELDYDLEALEATRETALEALTRAGARGADLIEAWIRRGNAAAVAEAAERSTGAVRKVARRGMNVLQARGVPIPERPRVSLIGAGKSPETFEAWLLAPDAGGSTLLVVAAHSPSSRYRVVFVHVHEALGVQRADQAEIAWSQLKETLNRAAGSLGVKPVKVPVEWARARIVQARTRNRDARLLEPLGLEQAKALLEPVPAALPPHPLDEEGLELTIEDARDLSKTSQVLHRLPEFRGWLPSREVVEEMMVAVGRHLKAGETPDHGVVEELLRQEVDSATDRYFSPQRRESLTRSMKDSALSVLEREGEQTALEVVAAIRCIEQAGLITDPPHEVPFLRAFFEKAVAALAAEGQGSLRIPVPPSPVGESLEQEANAGEATENSWPDLGPASGVTEGAGAEATGPASEDGATEGAGAEATGPASEDGVTEGAGAEATGPASEDGVTEGAGAEATGPASEDGATEGAAPAATEQNAGE